MLHLTNVMSYEYPQDKVVSPTMVDINFNVNEIEVDRHDGNKTTMFEYETYRFGSELEYLQWQVEENARQSTADSITLMMAHADSFEQQSAIQADQFTLMDAIADLYEQIATLKGGE